MEYLREKEITPETHERPLVSQLQQQLKDHLASKKSMSSRAKSAIENIIQDDSLLCKYVRVRCNDVDDAKKWILRNVKAECELYPDMDPPEKLTDPIRRVLSSRMITLLRHADPNSGRLIVVFDIGAWDPSVHPLEDMISTCKYLNKRAVDSTNCYEAGITVITIGNGTSFSHAKLCTIPALKKILNIFHQTMPIPLGSAFYVNAPGFIYPVYRFLKPFLPAKFKENFVISSGLDELHERIPLKILPECLGGEMRDGDDVTAHFLGLDEQFGEMIFNE